MASKPHFAMKPLPGSNLNSPVQKFLRQHSETSVGFVGSDATSEKTKPNKQDNEKSQSGDMESKKITDIDHSNDEEEVKLQKLQRINKVNVPKVFLENSETIFNNQKQKSVSNIHSNIGKVPGTKSSSSIGTLPGTKSSYNIGTVPSPKSPCNIDTTKLRAVDTGEKAEGKLRNSLHDKFPDRKEITVKNSFICSRNTVSVSVAQSEHTQSSILSSKVEEIDFRCKLKPVQFSAVHQTAKERNSLSPAPETSTVNRTKIASSVDASLNGEEQINKDKISVIEDTKVQTRSVITERKIDSKHFKQVRLENNSPARVAPSKPALICDISLADIQQEYKLFLQNLKEGSVNTDVNISDDMYIDATSVIDEQHKRPAATLPDHVSKTPDLRIDEEFGKSKATIDNELPQFPPPLPLARGKVQQPATCPVDKTSERISTIDEINQDSNCQLIGTEPELGEGILTADVQELSLRKGQTVRIVRVDKNPPNKWLIKADTGIHYVCSSIIKVNPTVIHAVMDYHKRLSAEKDQYPIYDYVEIEEEIYEQCT